MTEPMPYIPPDQPSEPYAVPSPDAPPVARRAWRLPVATGVAGLAVGALITAAITSGGSSNPAAAAIAATTSGSVENATPTTGAANASGAKGSGAQNGKGANARGVRGVITAENGTSWTVRSDAGPIVTVTISTTTKFGTKKVPATETQFAANSAVVVVGKRTGDTVVARRVIKPTAGTKAGGATTGAPTTR